MMMMANEAMETRFYSVMDHSVRGINISYNLFIPIKLRTFLFLAMRCWPLSNFEFLPSSGEACNKPRKAYETKIIKCHYEK